MPETTKRVRIGDYEYSAATLPPSGKGSASPVPRDALKALDQLGVDTVLVLIDAPPSRSQVWNTAAGRQGIRVVRFVNRNTHQNHDGKSVCDVYAVRVKP